MPSWRSHSGAEADDGRVGELRPVRGKRLRELGEVVDRQGQRAGEAAKADFLAIAGVQEHQAPARIVVALPDPASQRLRRHRWRAFAGVQRRCLLTTERDDLGLALYLQPGERNRRAPAFLCVDGRKTRIVTQPAEEPAHVIACAGQEQVETLRRHQHAAAQAAGLALAPDPVGQRVDIVDPHELVGSDVEDGGCGVGRHPDILRPPRAPAPSP